ncbi:unnamed protein product, partial [Ilex paraguariensis]
CGETSHGMAECKINERIEKWLFVDNGDLVEDQTDDFEQDPMFDEIDDSQFREEYVTDSVLKPSPARRVDMVNR